MSIVTNSLISVVVLAGIAAADDRQQPPAKQPAQPTKTAIKPPDPPKPPEPPTEVGAMAKTVVGTWKCAGNETAQDGSTAKMTATLSTKLDMDRWWISDTFEAKGRMTFKMSSYSTYDATSRKWRRVSIDNMGHQYIGTSDGLKDGKLIWHMDVLGTTGSGLFRDSIDSSDPKVGVKFSGEITTDKGKTWKPVYEMICKK